ncbi:hypothetical protein PPERSA_01583 [Pseudocohnilembus persalinus]|uniref:Deacetylase sirtuin-type domain-containing protein n=1 Tax=Pseudocohnilembus persalinus TaxID=266149 RepID=A0A0V0QHG2_PSEPJ|nr:hypothetical protein PPERSA_01583 [Pseudocohnilembus persalinus]|eukprot:KRX01713.1 hypothetical protein PPERSA_01583 [Pseudocohnilembus persalinus]
MEKTQEKQNYDSDFHKNFQEEMKAFIAKMDKSIQKCQNTINDAEGVKKSVQETFDKIDNFKNSFQNALDSMLNNVGKGLGLTNNIKNIEKFGNSKKIGDLKEIKALIQKKKHIVFLTGAGISLASGISTYRGKGAVDGFLDQKTGKHYKNQEIACHKFMQQNPEIFWQRFYDFWENQAKNAKCNISHDVISDLIIENGNYQLKRVNNDFVQKTNQIKRSVVKQTKNTQQSVTKPVHGNIYQARCDENCCQKIFEFPFQQLKENDFKFIICPFCKKNGRPNVLYFDEIYLESFYRTETLKNRLNLQQYNFNKNLPKNELYVIKENEQDCGQEPDICLIVIGTMLETGLASNIVSDCIENNILILEINYDPIILAGNNTYQIQGKAEEIVPKLREIFQ